MDLAVACAMRNAQCKRRRADKQNNNNNNNNNFRTIKILNRARPFELFACLPCVALRSGSLIPYVYEYIHVMSGFYVIYLLKIVIHW